MKPKTLHLLCISFLLASAGASRAFGQCEAGTPRFEAEPNNLPATANNLGAPSFVTVFGAISPVNDVDYYRFTAPPGSKAWITVDTGGAMQPGANSRDCLVTLYDAAFFILETDNNDGSGNGCDMTLETGEASAIAGRTLVAGGVYYLRVGAAGPGLVIRPYRLFLTVTDGPIPAEVEPNNTFGTANLLLPAGAISGVRSGLIAAPTDVDYFAVTILGRGILHISADGAGGSRGTSMKSVTITANVIRDLVEDRNNVGIYLRAHETANRDIVISHNTITGPTTGQTHVGIRLENSEAPIGARWFENVVIEGDVVRGNNYGMSLQSLINSRVAGNETTGCGTGIILDTCSSIVFDGNLVSGCGGGMQISAVRGVHLSDNLIKNSNAGHAFDAALVLVGDETFHFPTIELLAHGNKFIDDQDVPTQNWGVRQLGTGTFDTHFVDNDFRGNINGAFNDDEAIHRPVQTRRDNLGDRFPHAAARHQLSATAALDFNLSVASSQDLTVSVPGAAVGDVVSLGPDPLSITPDTIFSAWVGAPNVVTVRALRVAGHPNPPEGAFRVSVVGY